MLIFKDFFIISLIVWFITGRPEKSDSNKAELERIELNLRRLLEQQGMEYELYPPSAKPHPIKNFPNFLVLACTHKIEAIKQLRGETDLSLLEAKEAVEEMRRKLALSLYSEGLWPQDKAQKLANLSAWGFRQLLEARQIPPQVESPDLARELETLQQIE